VLVNDFNMGVISAMEGVEITISAIMNGEVEIPTDTLNDEVRELIKSSHTKTKQAVLANSVKQLRLRAPDMAKKEYQSLLSKVKEDHESSYGEIKLSESLIY